MKIRYLLVLAAVSIGLASPAISGNNSQAALTVHVVPWAKSADYCSESYRPTSHYNLVEMGTLCNSTDYMVYFLVCWGSDISPPDYSGSGVAGVEFGIDYDPSLFIPQGGMAHCTDQQFIEPGFPASGTGLVAIWDSELNCQSDRADVGLPNSVIAIVGAMLVTANAPGQLLITPRPISGVAKVADCDAVEDDLTNIVPTRLGAAGFCKQGYNSCWHPDPVTQTTWGGIKSLFH